MPEFLVAEDDLQAVLETYQLTHREGVSGDSTNREGSERDGHRDLADRGGQVYGAVGRSRHARLV
jgi:hypothetical protein